uniref:Putative ixodes 26 kDa salivary protein n=1 Tax=Ixodes ricinus TaxID=34613 RepID=A0A0K8RFN4_IXORI
MKAFIGALTFTLFAFCFATKEIFQKYYLNNDDDATEKGITIAFLLDGMRPEDANLKSEIGEWLDGATEVAQEELTKNLSVKIKLEITDIIIAPEAISKEIKKQKSGGQIRGPPILKCIKKTYNKTFNPDIICVVTAYSIFVGRLRDLVGYSKYTTLCEKMVPMLLTYNWDTMDDAPKAGILLSKLITSSLDYVRWRSTVPKEDYFIGCNIRHKLKAYGDDYDYFVLPFNKDDYYSY